ncbi:glycosyltransferase family 4 protein, partial [Candidatus Bathyarchaeota archaeon]|nr:glycosyltransferase family 4 protein [Candidatus Bathyarchaeota archaeon]
PVPEFESLIADMQAEHGDRKVTRCNHASDQDIISLYSEADVFVYPSLYEGFGLPVLEAMACGCPVITSNVSSLPEVAGDAAILVDPQDPNAIARAIITVLKDDKLKRELSERGVEQAKKFSWEKTAQDFLEVFDRYKS